MLAAAGALEHAGATVLEVDLGWTREVADAWVEHWDRGALEQVRPWAHYRLPI